MPLAPPQSLPLVVLLVMVLAGCERPADPVAPVARTGTAAAAALGILDAKDVAQLDFDVPADGRPWDVSDSALAAALEKSQGRAFVALKAPAAPRVSQTLRDEVLRPGREAVPRGTRAPITKAEIAEGLQAIGAFKVVVRQYFNAFGIVEATVEASTAAALRADPHVDFVEPVVDNWQMTEPAAPSVESPIGLPISMLSDSVPPGVALVGSPGAWPYTTGAGARLLIIDTGYDRGHPDLPNTLLGNCTHGQYGGCDDALPRDHGTHATGVMAGSQNGFGLVGVAPGVSSLDIYHWGACQNTEPGSCNTGEIVAALNWATTTLGARGVINISLATPVQHSTLGVAVSAAFSAGHLVVASTGNGGVQETLYPAAYTAALAVGAVNPDKTFPNPNVDFCNPTSAPGPSWGNHIDVVGPWFIGDEAAVGGGYNLNRCGGTSMAAAAVSGVPP